MSTRPMHSPAVLAERLRAAVQAFNQAAQEAGDAGLVVNVQSETMHTLGAGEWTQIGVRILQPC